MENVRVRFAPSPTGLLHIGGARTALFNWLYARHTGGTFVLRIEDTDAARNTPEAVRVIFEGLQWLGIDWDEGPQTDGTERGERGPYFQSKRNAIYQRYVEKLLQGGHAYEDEGTVRFRLPKSPILVPDLICGNVTFDRSMEPDPVIRRKDGSLIFHLVNVVDDIEMGITHVIRGEDHLSNTPKHIAIFNALGVQPPKFAHIPLILNSDGSKMSKRDRGASIANYIEDGYLPNAVRNYLNLLGWSLRENRDVFPISEAIEKFDLPQINRSNARFDMNKLFWINGEYMRAASIESIEPHAVHILRAAHVLPEHYDAAYFRAALSIVKEKIKLGKELPEWMDYFFKEDFPYDAEAAKKHFTPEGFANLQKLHDALAGMADFSAVSMEQQIKNLAANTSQKAGAFIHPTRLAVSGKPVGPSLYHLLEVLGKERVMPRIQRALKQKS